MTLNPLTEIAGPESSYGANLYNPQSSATGVWQDISSTWRENVAAIGLSPSQYPTAASAPLSVQAAVNANLYNTRGFQPWTVGDPTLTRNITAAGGPSAFAAPGTLSTDPADYASLDQPGGLQAYFAGSGTTAPAGGSSLADSAGYPFSFNDPASGTPFAVPGNAAVSGSGTAPLSGSGQPGGIGGSAASPSQTWWQTLVSGVTSEIERVGIMGFGVLLLVAAALALMWPHARRAARQVVRLAAAE